MSTGPGPTRKADESHDASVDDIADLLVEEESHPVSVQTEKPFDDGLDVMLETPGPVLANTFMPPPPAPMGLIGEEGDSVEESGAATNLAYEDLLAKLVLPAKASEPEPTMPVPAPVNSLPLPDLFGSPLAASSHEPVLPAISLPASPTFQMAPPTEERTLVTENPLVAEEQQAAAREGRVSITREQPRVIQEELQPGLTEPIRGGNGAAKSKLLYLLFGGLLVLGGMVLATLVLKLLMPTPVAQPAVVVVPAPVPQPTPAPPAQVQPLPPTPPVAPVPTIPSKPAEPGEAKAAPAVVEDAPSAVETEKPQSRTHKRERSRVTRGTAVAKPALAAPSAKTPTPTPKAATPTPKSGPPAPAAKPAKKGKTSGYADPFDN